MQAHRLHPEGMNISGILIQAMGAWGCLQYLGGLGLLIKLLFLPGDAHTTAPCDQCVAGGAKVLGRCNSGWYQPVRTYRYARSSSGNVSQLPTTSLGCVT